MSLFKSHQSLRSPLILVEMQQTDLHSAAASLCGSRSLSLPLSLSLFLWAHWYAWSSEASLNWLIVIFSCSGTDAFHFLSGLSVTVIKHLLQRQRGVRLITPWMFPPPQRGGLTFCNIYVIYQISIKGRSEVLVLCMCESEWQLSALL